MGTPILPMPYQASMEASSRRKYPQSATVTTVPEWYHNHSYDTRNNDGAAAAPRLRIVGKQYATDNSANIGDDGNGRCCVDSKFQLRLQEGGQEILCTMG